MKKLEFVSHKRRIDYKILASGDWRRLKEHRLAALRESPDAFLANHDEEEAQPESWWREELARSRWHVGVPRNFLVRIFWRKPISLIGVTQEDGKPDTERFLEYLWVAPGRRQKGFGLDFINAILSYLKDDGVSTVQLWVLDGNDAAVGLYRKAGFEIAGPPVPLEALPGRTEQLWRLELADPDHPDEVRPGMRHG